MSDRKDKPVFDEQTLAHVLEAAYVLQEHNRALELSLELQSDQLREQQAESASRPAAFQTAVEDKTSQDASHQHDDYTLILAQIVETQHQIQVRQLELGSALALIAERLTQITGASGAAVGIVEEKAVRYRAGSGPSALPRGTELPMEKALCFTCLHTGKVMRCADVNPEFLLDAEACHRRGIHSLIAVPVYHDGGIIGALELYFGNVQAFADQDVHTCQLMAGLVTEAFTRDEQLTWKKSFEVERATMLEALGRLKPSLEALADSPALKDAAPKEVAAAPVAEQSFACRKCGHALVAEEQFCGKCGTPRIVDNEPLSLQSKVASLWQMTQSKNAPHLTSNDVASAEPQGKIQGKSSELGFSESHFHKPDCTETDGEAETEEDRRERELAKLLANMAGNAGTPAEDRGEAEGPQELLDVEVVGDRAEGSQASTSETALEKRGGDIAWPSAAKARDFLEQVAQSKSQIGFQRFWSARRGDLYLAVALILMAIVIRWGVWSDHTVGASGTGIASASHQRPNAELSMFEKFLVSTGLAEAPDKPEPKGNPDTQVWVDLHTALYYCPGTDLYGRTPKGKFTSQKDAQLDQFEPAYRKACD